ncbi:MAG: radical SAM protein, partial [Chloroflexales bacterium]|nr:radical SAM protein [Chloroflexales bacterium]
YNDPSCLIAVFAHNKAFAVRYRQTAAARLFHTEYCHTTILRWINHTMAYYIRDNLPSESILGSRRPTINEFFLSSYTMSIYTGCELGCSYCDGWAYSARPLTEAVRVPLDLPQRLAAELDSVDRGDLIAITALSDPYQPAEQIYRITRQVLQALSDAGQPCLIMTKSARILDDLPVLKQLNERSLAIVMTTLLTINPQMAERLDGKAPPPRVRLDTLKALKQAGIPVGVALLPIIPYVNDADFALVELLRACAKAEVDFVIWDYLHIPNERHRTRINEILARVGSYPASYYRDIYGNQPFVSASYRAERDAVILQRCDGLDLEPRVPHKIFAGWLRPANEIALLLKHAAFRDTVRGRHLIARRNRELAELAYQDKASREDLSASPLWPTIRRVLYGEPDD